ncbi:sigma-E factor negative regulatory protein [Rhodanobacter sp. DHB23]|uniref:sigma-E factor negative regulatory protein n=1 Tax=Rhodanobacter sp. DHB23 TaxID=2775923 RepID=UPI0017806D6C|nr:sigma-E factor negative regulatory protein [Rhodanobacter sp. DHB23]MBD8873551.1 sigma-E factor negative regulatory protein [Rhodanobacter sp. DHB23]
MNQPDQHAREHLSAGIDGELAHEELRFLLRRLDHDVELQRTWVSYHLARDGLRRQLPPLAGSGFSARVMLAIEQETVSVAVAAPRHHRWLRWSTGGAIAASVAAAALMVSQPTGNAGRHAAAQTAQATTGVPVRNAPSVAPQAEVAAVPQWLSGKAPGLLSQQASATLGAPANADFSAYGRGASPFQVQRYRTLDNHDGSYLILLDPAQQPVPDAPRRDATSNR